MVAAVLVAFPARPVAACGGFFCSQSGPVNQQSEEIIFVDNPDDTVTAVIRIRYVGPSERFAWLLPVSGAPKVEVSSNSAFDSLRRATDPGYVLDVEVDGECREEEFGDAEDAGSEAVQDAASSEPTVDFGIRVVDSGSVGPYDYVTIGLDPALPNPADAAVSWLTDNGYDVTGVAPSVLGPYLADGLNLIAFKLTKGTQTGAIRPVRLTYESTLPVIPIRPTAVAAVEDMGVLVYVVGPARGVPKNYKSLLLNEALINWFYYRGSYDEVVGAAADEAGGQGFVTELAGPAKVVSGVVWSGSDGLEWEAFLTRNFVDGYDMIEQASPMFRFHDGWREAIEAAVTLPEGVTLDQFGRDPESYRDSVVIDTEAFLEALTKGVVEPVIQTQKLLDSRPYFTRLYSTLSPAEMTLDPLFDFNPDLADVSNVHTAKQWVTCDEDTFFYQAPWRIELPQGDVLHGVGREWPLSLADGLPASLQISQLSTSGPGRVVQDNRSSIAEMVTRMAPPPGNAGGQDAGMMGVDNAGAAMGTPEPKRPEVEAMTVESGTDGGLCAVRAGAGGGAGAGLGGLIGIAVLFGVRRRRGWC